MKPRLAVATHISMALALITASVLLVAHSIGLVPDPRQARLLTRETIAELVSRCAADTANSGDTTALDGLARQLVERNPDVLSVGVRLADGTLTAATPRHAELWPDAQRFVSTPEFVRIPLLREGAPYAEVEIRFRDLSPRGVPGLIAHPLTPLLLFAVVGGFVAYRLYMRTVLKYLDPTAVIPERVRLVLDALAEGVMLLDNEGRIILINRALARMLGCGLDAVIGKPAASFEWIDCHTRVTPIPYPWLETVEDGAMRAAARLELRTPEGRGFLVSAACAPITAADGVRRGVIVTLADLTEVEAQKGELELLVRSLSESRREIARQNDELQRLATTDGLTECLTRRALHERASHLWSLAARHARPIACLMIDADHFKAINDTRGHQAGDQVLRRITEILRDAARTEDVVGRYGGEEFCMVLPETDAAGASVVAERIRTTIAATPLEGVPVTVSIGVAEGARADASFESILDRADRALYDAKRAGRNRVAVADSPRRAAA